MVRSAPCKHADTFADSVNSYIVRRAVYGRESRLKVARDEAKFAEETKVKRERHLQVSCRTNDDAFNHHLAGELLNEKAKYLHATFCRLSVRQEELLCFRRQGTGRYQHAIAHTALL